MLKSIVLALTLFAAPPPYTPAIWSVRTDFSSGGRTGDLIIEGKVKVPANHVAKIYEVQSTNPRVLVLSVKYFPHPEPGIDVSYKNIKYIRKGYMIRLYDRVTIVNQNTDELRMVEIK